MIVILSTCSEKLSEDEFVKPIEKILNKGYEVKHYTDKINFSRYDRIIICGTALADNAYLENMDKFDWIKECNVPILGICSGMQVIALQFDAKLIKKKEIGMTEIETIKENRLFSGNFEAYELHGNGLSDLGEFDILAISKKTAQAIKLKKKGIYGLMFHPEVRNPGIIEKFLKI